MSSHSYSPYYASYGHPGGHLPGTGSAATGKYSPYPLPYSSTYGTSAQPPRSCSAASSSASSTLDSTRDHHHPHQPYPAPRLSSPPSSYLRPDSSTHHLSAASQSHDAYRRSSSTSPVGPLSTMPGLSGPRSPPSPRLYGASRAGMNDPLQIYWSRPDSGGGITHSHSLPVGRDFQGEPTRASFDSRSGGMQNWYSDKTIVDDEDDAEPDGTDMDHAIGGKQADPSYWQKNQQQRPPRSRVPTSDEVIEDSRSTTPKPEHFERHSSRASVDTRRRSPSPVQPSSIDDQMQLFLFSLLSFVLLHILPFFAQWTSALRYRFGTYIGSALILSSSVAGGAFLRSRKSSMHSAYKAISAHPASRELGALGLTVAIAYLCILLCPLTFRLLHNMGGSAPFFGVIVGGALVWWSILFGLTTVGVLGFWSWDLTKVVHSIVVKAVRYIALGEAAEDANEAPPSSTASTSSTSRIHPLATTRMTTTTSTFRVVNPDEGTRPRGGYDGFDSVATKLTSMKMSAVSHHDGNPYGSGGGVTATAAERFGAKMEYDRERREAAFSASTQRNFGFRVANPGDGDRVSRSG